MDTNSNSPDTIVLIHGFWVTPRSWEDWISHFEGRGYKVLAPAYPGFEVEVEALNADTTPIEKVTVPQIVEHLESVVGGLDSPPIIMGHSAGGVFTQILLDHGFGAVGVAINSAPTEGVKRIPLSQVRSSFPVLKNPANRHKAVGLTPEQWHYTFTNTFSEDESQRLYERYHIPASGSIFWSSALANIHPGKDDTWVDYHNANRAPLLFISGSDDHLMPPSIQKSNAKHYKAAGTITEVKEFEGPHLLPSREGWQEVADYALSWAESHATSGAARQASGVTSLRVTHIGGPTTLIEVEGWRLLTDPTFDPPGRKYHFGWGSSSRKVVGPAVEASDIGPVDAVLLTHDHHPDNLDDEGRKLLPSADVVVTTVSGAKRLGGNARGLAAWDATRLESPGRPPIDVTATPCRHGPPGSHPIVGDVIGFALRWDGQEHGVLWISGDTVLYDGVRQVADRLEVDTALDAPRRRALSDNGATALHDDGPRRGRALRPSAAAHRHPGPLRGLVTLQGRPGRHRARARARS